MSLLNAFVSYRTNDTGRHAVQVAERLKGDLGLDAVYYAPTDNELFDDWAAKIVDRLAASQVVVALIGPNWRNCNHDEHHEGCIFDEADWVRREVQYGLSDPDTALLPVAMGIDRLPAKEEVPDDLRTLSTTQGVVVGASAVDDVSYQEILTGCWLSLKHIDSDTTIVVSDGSDEAEVILDELIAALRKANLIDSSRLSSSVNDPQGLRAIPLRKAKKKWPRVITIAPRTQRDILVARCRAIARSRSVQSAVMIGGSFSASEVGLTGIARDAGVDIVSSSVDAVTTSIKGGPWSWLGAGGVKLGAAALGATTLAGVAYLLVAPDDDGLNGFLSVVGASDAHALVLDADGDLGVIDTSGSGDIEIVPTAGGQAGRNVVYQPAADLAAFKNRTGDDLGVMVWSPDLGEVARIPAADASALAISPGGEVIAIGRFGVVELWSIGGNATEPDRTFPVEVEAWSLAFSPDGSKLAMMPTGVNSLQTIDLADGNRTVLLEPDESLGEPSWSPDGTMIAVQTSFGSSPTGSNGFLIVDVNSQSATRLDTDRFSSANGRQIWSADSKQILFESFTGSRNLMCFLDVSTGSSECLDTGPASHQGQFTWMPRDLDIIAAYPSCGFDTCDANDEGLWRIRPSGEAVTQVLRHSSE